MRSAQLTLCNFLGNQQGAGEFCCRPRRSAQGRLLCVWMLAERGMCSDDLGNHAQGTLSEGKGSTYIQVANKFRLHRCARTGASSLLSAQHLMRAALELSLFSSRAPFHIMPQKTQRRAADLLRAATLSAQFIVVAKRVAIVYSTCTYAACSGPAILTLIIFFLLSRARTQYFPLWHFVCVERAPAWILLCGWRVLFHWIRCSAISLSDAGLIWPILVVSGWSATGNHLYSRRRAYILCMLPIVTRSLPVNWSEKLLPILLLMNERHVRMKSLNTMYKI